MSHVSPFIVWTRFQS
uniref:Uncharacterized protein n=1 Tax=Anguilla anguilla TaxID=7936 RepID=A0A0E9PSD0_ANGAN